MEAHEEQPSLSGGVIRTALIGMVLVAGVIGSVLAFIFL
jgi:hypothetical protein